MTFPVAKQARRKAHWAARKEGKNGVFGVTKRQQLPAAKRNNHTISQTMKFEKHVRKLHLRVIKHYRRIEDALKQEAAQARSEVPAFGT